MWTRAPPLTSDHSVVPSCCCCCLVLDQEAEEGELSEAFSLRLHYNHQPGEQEQLEYYAASTKRTLALREYSLPFSPSQPTAHIHHDLPEAAGAFKRLPTEGFVPKKSSHMSTPESTRVLARRVRQPQPQLHVGSTKRTSHGCMRCPATERRRLDDMQTQIANAKHTLLNAASDQQVPELDDLVSSSKRRRVLVPQNGFLQPTDSLDQACEDHSGVTAEQHMAKASTPEDIDSPAPASKSDQVARCSNTKPQEVEQESTHVEPLEQQQPRRFSDDDTQSTSQIPSVPSRYPAKTMASHGSDEWLQLSLGSGVQSEETQPEEQQAADRPQSPVLADPQGSSVRDFFKFGSETGPSTFTSSPITPRHRYSGTPEPRPFLEPRPRSSRDSPWVDPNARLPRGPSSGGEAGQFLLPGLQPAFSNLATLAYHPARVVQPVRSEQTETTSVHAAPWMGMGMPQPPHHHEAPNPAEFLSMATPGAFRDWRSGAGPSFLSMQPPLAQGVDADLAWRNLLQRVGSNLSVPSGFGGGAGAAASSSSSGRGEAMMLPPGEREECMDALTRAVERFQGADQGGKDEPLTELQRLQRNAMFPLGQRPHLGPSFDPSTDINLARYFSTPSSSGSRPRAPAPAAAAAASSDRQRRILRPHAPRPGLWFTLQASNSQPEASPLQQIPTAYIRVVDDNMTVAAVRRYLVTKLALASEDEVELTCKGQLLQPSISLSQVRDGIWHSPNTNTPNPSTSQLLSEGKAWKAPDGSITLVGDVVMVLTYGRRPPAPPPTSA